MKAGALTTAEAGRLMGVSTRTVCRLADQGHLKAWRVPGSSHRRVERGEVERFMSEHGIPKEEVRSGSGS